MKLVCLSLCGLIGVLNLTGCSRISTPTGPAAPEVLVITVALCDVPVVKEGVAALNGFINPTIAARVPGYVISQNCEQGSVVKKDDLLFQIDPRPFEEESARGQEVAQRLSDSVVPV